MNIKQILAGWGYWASLRLDTYYPSVSAGFREMINEAECRYRVVPIEEDLAWKVENAMLALRKVDYELFEVIILRYVRYKRQGELSLMFKENPQIKRRDWFNKLFAAERAILLKIS